jgi:hypothetical protein
MFYIGLFFSLTLLFSLFCIPFAEVKVKPEHTVPDPHPDPADSSSVGAGGVTITSTKSNN